MPTSTLEPLTILAPSPLSETNSAGDEHCGCGCGCEVSLTQLAPSHRTPWSAEETKHTHSPRSRRIK